MRTGENFLPLRPVIKVAEIVIGFRQVAASYDDRSTAEVMELRGGHAQPRQDVLPRPISRRRLNSCQHSRLVQVRSDYVSEREQLLPENLLTGLIQQNGARRRPQHRIKHDV